MITDSIFEVSSSWITRCEIDSFLRFTLRFARSLHPLASLEVSLLEHFFTRFIQRPVVSFAISSFLWDLHKAFIQREIVSNGVLPAFLVLCIVWEIIHNELIDATQRESLIG